METPKLVKVEQVSDGWVKKYLLSYELPDGSLFEYQSASRHNEAEYRAALERNAEVSERVMADSCTEEQPQAAATVPDAVCVVARTPRDTLVMIREFRYAMNSWCIAFPAGLVDPGESLSESAGRELSEETGYEVVPESPSRVLPQPGCSSTGLTDEAVQVVFVEAEKTGDAHAESNEFIEVFELPIADARRFLDENELPICARAQLVLESFA